MNVSAISFTVTLSPIERDLARDDRPDLKPEAAELLRAAEKLVARAYAAMEPKPNGNAATASQS